MIFYSIANDFTKTPGLRYRHQSKFSGQEFREDKLVKLYLQAKKNKELITIDLDGTYGYPKSFISEAFGGLPRQLTSESRSEIYKRFRFISNDQPDLPDRIASAILSETEK